MCLPVVSWEPTLILPPILQSRDITNNNHTNTIDPTTTHTRNRPENKKLLLRLCKSTQQITQGDQCQAEQQAVLPTKDIGQPAVDELKGGGCDEERRANPGRRTTGVELSGDGWYAGRHACLVDKGDEEGYGEGWEGDEEGLLGH